MAGAQFSDEARVKVSLRDECSVMAAADESRQTAGNEMRSARDLLIIHQIDQKT